VLQQIPSIEGSLIGIPHPYIFGVSRVSIWPQAEVPSFGFLGLASLAKGFDVFQTLAEAISIPMGSRAKFRLVGHFSRECPGPGKFVESLTRTNSAHLERTSYENAVEQLTYCVLPYDSNEYGLISSGAILDAFTYAKPCIALRNPLFQEYFEAMGDIGYLCDSRDEMRELIASLISSPPRERYRQQSENILAGRHIFEPDCVARQLGESLRPADARSPLAVSLQRNS
jgi:hypothetical protein